MKLGWDDSVFMVDDSSAVLLFECPEHVHGMAEGLHTTVQSKLKGKWAFGCGAAYGSIDILRGTPAGIDGISGIRARCLCAHAAPGQIYIDEPIYHRLAPHHASCYQPVDSIPGPTDESFDAFGVALLTAIHPIKTKASTEASQAGSDPKIGRDSEIAPFSSAPDRSLSLTVHHEKSKTSPTFLERHKVKVGILTLIFVSIPQWFSSIWSMSSSQPFFTWLQKYLPAVLLPRPVLSFPMLLLIEGLFLIAILTAVFRRR